VMPEYAFFLSGLQTITFASPTPRFSLSSTLIRRLKLDSSPPEESENVLIFYVAYMGSAGSGAAERAERIA
jgi:hypothetical protein